MKRIRIGSFNTYNLVSAGATYYDKVMPEADYRKKTRWVGQQLARMNARIIGFQEVFHKAALEACLRQARNENKIYEQARIECAGEDGEEPGVALLSSFPIRRAQTIRDFPPEAILDIEGAAIPLARFHHPVLRCELALGGETLKVYVTHLKSKRPMMPEEADKSDPLERARGAARSLILRAAEAAALRALLLEDLRGDAGPTVVIGDLNDNGLAVTSRIISGDPPYKRMPKRRKIELWDVLLHHVQDIQARQSYRDIYYTYIHNGFYESLDHIMVSQEFDRAYPKHIGYVEYVALLNDHLIDKTLSNDRIPRWKSDHGQVVATLKLHQDIPEP